MPSARKKRKSEAIIKPVTTARFVRDALAISREDFAKVLRCAPASVYRWEESGVDPKGLYGELLGYMAERLRARPIDAVEWGTTLLRAGTVGRWLIFMVMAPPTSTTREERREAHSEAMTYLLEERAKDVSAIRGHAVGVVPSSDDNEDNEDNEGA
jgi:hypothetical protein